MKVEPTQRGFDRIDFKDQCNVACSLQKSSIAAGACIWLGLNDADPQVLVQDQGWQKVQLPEGVCVSTRMHLTRQGVKELLPHLQAFARTGDIAIVPPTKAQLWRRVARLCGEMMMFGPDSVCYPSPANERPLEFARRVAAMQLSGAFSPAYRKLIGKIQTAFKAWEAAP